MTPLSKTQQLFIRACKVKEPRKRVVSVYKRFYLFPEEDTSYQHIGIILAEVCDKLKLYTTVELLRAFSPNKRWQDPHCQESYHQRAVHEMISKIRFTDVAKIQGYHPPLCWRKKHE